MVNIVKGIIALVASLMRPMRGTVAVGHRRQPEQTLILYEAEYCPYCRYVREALTALDLDALIYPIPKRGQRFKERLLALGGKPQIPFLLRNVGKTSGRLAEWMPPNLRHKRGYVPQSRNRQELAERGR